jgi:hypothetical protein
VKRKESSERRALLSHLRKLGFVRVWRQRGVDFDVVQYEMREGMIVFAVQVAAGLNRVSHSWHGWETERPTSFRGVDDFGLAMAAQRKLVRRTRAKYEQGRARLLRMFNG